jgi:hypothetical protein
MKDGQMQSVFDAEAGEMVFESGHEKGVLTGLMASAAFYSLLGVGLMKRYPKWGARYLLAQGVFAALASVVYARGRVEQGVDQ